jgi:hypothetical protein
VTQLEIFTDSKDNRYKKNTDKPQNLLVNGKDYSRNNSALNFNSLSLNLKKSEYKSLLENNKMNYKSNYLVKTDSLKQKTIVKLSKNPSIPQFQSNYYNNFIADKIKRRENMTKMISKSFIDEREMSKDYLRNCNEKQKFFLHSENKDYKYEKALNKIKERDVLKNKLSQSFNCNNKIDEYYQKYVK